MTKHFLFLSFLITSLAAVAQTKVPLADVSKHIGENVTLTGIVADGRYLDKSKSKLTLLNMGATFPNQLLTIVIQDENRKNFSYKPEDELKNKTVTVTGKISEFNGKPQITISAPTDIQLVESPAPPPVEVSRQLTPEEEENIVFTKVEEPASFPGGHEGWKSYLERNLNAQVAADDRAKRGLYKVKVQFIVDKHGFVSDVRAIEGRKECPSCMFEAVRVIRTGPKWIPAKQNGKTVKYQAIQFITFQVL